MLEYMLGEARSYLWLVMRTRSAVTTSLKPGNSIKPRAAFRNCSLRANSLPTVKRLRRNTRDRPGKTEFDQAAVELSQMILGPVAGKLGKKRLLIVGDGILQYIPFGVLPEPESGRAGEDGATWRRGDGAIARQEGGETKRKVKPRPRRPVATSPRRLHPPDRQSRDCHIALGFSAGDAAAYQDRAIRRPDALAVLADPVFSSEDLRVGLDARTKIKFSSESWSWEGTRGAERRRQKSLPTLEGRRRTPACRFSDDCFSAARRPKR